ncbi:MAG: PIG-L family deacetylase [Clostridia bacterium]|nr:PIG-L family deacetylase [Clostridia bacterium]
MKIYQPTNLPTEKTTVLCIAAHQDDVEMLASFAIGDCYDSDSEFFSGVVMTDGANSPRTGDFADFSPQQMIEAREKEQMKAADIGKYCAAFMCGYTSDEIKQNSENAINDIADIIQQTKPHTIVIHNLADKHQTHVATAICSIEAIRRSTYKPENLYLAEVWRSLDWLCDEDKVVKANSRPDITLQQLCCFESQVAGGKRYDKACLGRQLANATFYQSHSVDNFEYCNYLIDGNDLLHTDITPEDFIKEKLDNFYKSVLKNIKTPKDFY